MPREDRTGPMGRGPRTGRGYGDCAETAEPGNNDPGFASGRRFRVGGDRGWQHRFRSYGPQVGESIFPTEPTMTREQEAEWLQTQVQELQETIKQIQDRISKLNE
jgi:hypothetical protein